MIKQKKFINLLLSEISSSIGEWLVTLGIQMILIFHLKENIVMVSMLYLAALTPKLFIPPLVGRLLDKLSTKRTLILSGIRAFAFVLSLMLLLINIPLFFILVTFILNIFLSGEEPASLGIIRNADASEEDKEKVLGIFYMLTDILRIVGPMIAAGIMLFSQGKIIFIVASFFFLVASILSATNYGVKVQALKNKKKIIPPTSLSIRDILNNKFLLFIFICIFVFLFSINMIDTSIGILIQSLADNAIYQSLFIAFMGLGGVVGSLIVMRFISKPNILKITISSMIIFGIIMFAIPLVSNIWILISLATIGGGFIPGIIMTAEIKRQSLVAKEQSSQLSGMALSFNALGQSIGILSSSVVVTLFGAEGVFIVSGALIFGTGCIGYYFLSKQFKKIEHP